MLIGPTTLFWLVAVILTVAVCLALLRPLVGRIERFRNPIALELDVYKDQFAELDRDAERGLIEPAEAELARAEIGRKIIRLAGAEDCTRIIPSGKISKWTAMSTVLSLSVLAWGLYLATGEPYYSDQPTQI